MDETRKEKLLKDLQPEFRGTAAERFYLSTFEEDYVPAFIKYAKTVEQVLEERTEMLKASEQENFKLRARILELESKSA